MSTYPSLFYSARATKVQASADVIVPIIFDLVRPASVVDVGCAQGEWLTEFQRHGCADILGIDGTWVKVDELLIPHECFISHDLRSPLTTPKRFDLAISLEIAEHIPESDSNKYLISLTALSDIIVFSAAIPFQGGMGHVNEQWPGYWSRRFADHGYMPIDIIREKIWDNDAVQPHYAQNIMMFVKESAIADNPRLQTARKKTDPLQLTRIHPKLYTSVCRDMADRIKQQEKICQHPLIKAITGCYRTLLKIFRHFKISSLISALLL